jgi:hypothetical protein
MGLHEQGDKTSQNVISLAREYQSRVSDIE